MKRSMKNMLDYSVQGLDGPEGKVNDLLFDEEGWIMRYLDADFGKELAGKRHLIPSTFLEEPEWERERFPVNLKKEHIEACPELDEQMPVSREYEKKLTRHYGIDMYWPFFYTEPAGSGIFYPPRPVHIPTKLMEEDDINSNLRSFREVEGYAIHAADGRMGRVVDIIMDDDDWQLVYLIVDTHNWLPWSRKVILSVEWLHSISYFNREINIGIDTETIKEAPEFNPKHPVDMDYERALYEYYQGIPESHK
jgi:hypothetical protein